MGKIQKRSIINYICSMKTSIFIVVFSCVTSILFAQQSIDTTFVDHKYKEDQFYFSITYELLGKKAKEIKQSGFSSGIHFGVIKDMPINERRNKAFGIGLGLSVNSFNQNMLISPDPDGGYTYQIIDESEITVKRNKFTTYLIEMPLQYRWRTSTAKDYKFWRIYSGVKIGYLLYNSSKFVGSIDDVKLSGIDDFNKLQYGLTLNAGYSTWNFHVYYGLNSIFNDSVKLNGKSVDMNSIKIGLMFYIL
ncbi:porin family protein [Gelidibacter pelagius]|nr:porin family protein [Gelidibacter pelagius]